MSKSFRLIPSPDALDEADSMEVNLSPSLWDDTDDSDGQAQIEPEDINVNRKRKKHYCETSDNEDDTYLTDLQLGNEISDEDLMRLWLSKIDLHDTIDQKVQTIRKRENVDTKRIPSVGVYFLTDHANYTNPYVLTVQTNF